MVIYHCVDEYSAFSGVQREALIRMERDLLCRADLVITSSERLFEERRTLNARTQFVSHGVDVRHFGRALEPSTPVPAELGRLRRPVVGFFGLLADWVDIELVRAAAIARPKWSFALVGNATVDTSPLSGLPNVHLLGHKPYDVLPDYCRGFDVGIIPFRINALTTRANPLKLREYLAAGLPVVAADLPEVRRYDGLVRLAEGPEAFIREIESAFGERGEPFIRRRVEAMQRESWEARVEELSSLIEATEVGHAR